MGIIARKKQADFSVPPEGLYAAVCCDVVDLGTVKDQWGERPMVQVR